MPYLRNLAYSQFLHNYTFIIVVLNLFHVWLYRLSEMVNSCPNACSDENPLQRLLVVTWLEWRQGWKGLLGQMANLRYLTFPQGQEKRSEAGNMLSLSLSHTHTDTHTREVPHLPHTQISHSHTRNRIPCPSHFREELCRKGVGYQTGVWVRSMRLHCVWPNPLRVTSFVYMFHLDFKICVTCKP